MDEAWDVVEDGPELAAAAAASLRAADAIDGVAAADAVDDDDDGNAAGGGAAGGEDGGDAPGGGTGRACDEGSTRGVGGVELARAPRVRRAAQVCGGDRAGGCQSRAAASAAGGEGGGEAAGGERRPGGLGVVRGRRVDGERRERERREAQGFGGVGSADISFLRAARVAAASVSPVAPSAYEKLLMKKSEDGKGRSARHVPKRTLIGREVPSRKVSHRSIGRHGQSNTRGRRCKRRCSASRRPR